MSHRDLPAPLLKVNRMTWLMALYAENFERLIHLLGEQRKAPGRYQSRGHDGLDLILDVIEIHSYTSELRLSYTLQDPVTGNPDPSVFVRVYFDSKQAEATHCYAGRDWQEVLGLRPSMRVLVGHRLRMNSFLNKWLDYLDIQGHGPHTFERVDAEEGNR
jgi:uncharacterized protein